MIGPKEIVLDQYWRNCRAVYVHDGDTLNVEIDLGYAVRMVLPLRLYGINAPELNTEAGKKARLFVEAWVAENATPTDGMLLVKYISWDKYAPRFDGILISSENGKCINDDLVSSGNAVVFNA